MSGNVNVNRQASNFGTKFATTRLIVSSNATVSGKKRRSVSIVPEAEKNQIMAVNRFASLRGDKVELVLILLRRDLWIDLTAHTQD